MAIRVELNKESVQDALQKSIDSAKRLQNSTRNPQFKALADQQLRELTQALNTLTEVK